MTFSVTNMWDWIGLLFAGLFTVQMVRHWRVMKRRWKIGYVLIFTYLLVALFFGEADWYKGSCVIPLTVLLIPGLFLIHDAPNLFLFRKINQPADGQDRGNS